MVRKYNPEVKTEYGRGMWDGSEYHEAVMKEEQHGKWVKLETFNNVTSLQRKEIARQQDHIKALQARIDELTHGVTLKTEECPCCDQTIIGFNRPSNTEWQVICQVCDFEGPTVHVKPEADNQQAQRIALVAWNKRSTRQRKAAANKFPIQTT